MTSVIPGGPHTDPWAKELVDLEALNAKATDAIVQSVNRLRDQAKSDHEAGPVEALVAVGPAGVGKTHLFARLRRKLGANAVLVHVRPLVGAEMTPRFLLGQILQQLGYPVADSDGRPQIDLIAGGALAVSSDHSHRFPGAHLQELRELPADVRAARVAEALDRILSRHPDLDLTYIEQLMRVPFSSPIDRVALMLWLGGREPTESQAQRIGVRDALPDGSVIPALRTLAAVSAKTTPLVVVFDQLENLVDPSGAGTRVTAYGNLIADLVDVVRDLIIVQMGLDTEWSRSIEPVLSTAQRSRVMGRRIPLALPTPVELEALLKLWSERVAHREAPFPWPFKPQQLTAICSVPGTTPRMLWVELRRALAGEPSLDHAAKPPSRAQTSTDPDDAIAEEWAARVRSARAHIDEKAQVGLGPEPAFLVDGLVCLLSFLGPVRGAKALGPDEIQLDGEVVTHRIALVHQTSPRSIGATFRRLAQARKRIVVLREGWRDWPPTWKVTRSEWNALRQRSAVCWHWIDREDSVRLLALASLIKDARSADVSGPDGKPVSIADVTKWLRSKEGPGTWAVSKVILGDAEPGAEVSPESPGNVPAEEGAATVQDGSFRATALLHELRVASLERLVRDLAKTGNGVTRASVIAELRANKRIRWIGSTLVTWAEGGEP